MEYQYANFRATGLKNNDWFNTYQRDNCTYPFQLLREKFYKSGVILNTPDINYGKEIQFEIHVDVQNNDDISVPSFLFLWETDAVQPTNSSIEKIKRYRRVYSWNDDLVESNGYEKFFLPIVKADGICSFGWASRNKFCCAIAGNKQVKRYDERELYSKRIETFRWFEKNAPSFFDLYGVGWEKPPATIGLMRNIKRQSEVLLNRVYGLKPFRSYCGEVGLKKDVLVRYKFSICYENFSGLSGYVTEKIFDCFFAGCVPIYWGAKNIYDYIPRECFIDRRDFQDHLGLYEYITAMTEDEYIDHQKAIQKFLASDVAEKFYSESFSTSIVSNLLKDVV